MRYLALLLALLTHPLRADELFVLEMEDALCPIGGEVTVWATITYNGSQPIEIVASTNDETDPVLGLWGLCGVLSVDSPTVNRPNGFNYSDLYLENRNDRVGMRIEPGQTFELPLFWLTYASHVPPGTEVYVTRIFAVEAIVWHNRGDPQNQWCEYFSHGSNEVRFTVTAVEPPPPPPVEFEAGIVAEFAAGVLTLSFRLQAPAPATWHFWLWPARLWTIPLPALDVDFDLEFPFPAGAGRLVVISALTTSRGVEDFDFALFDT